MESQKLEKVLAGNMGVFQGTMDLMKLRHQLRAFAIYEGLTDAQKKELCEIADALAKVEDEILKAKNEILFSL